MYPRLGGNEIGVADEEKQLTEDAKKSREETQELREKGDVDRDAESGDQPDEGEPWAKASSGDADSVTDDD